VSLLLDSLPSPKTAHWQDVRWLVEIVTRHDARTNFADVSLAHLQGLISPEKSWQRQGPDFGIPIGNLTSQFAANAILTGLDHYVARQLRPGAYARYMDDLLLFGDSRDELAEMAPKIDHWLRKNRRQALHPGKTKLTRLDEGIEFLGYRLRQTPNPANPLRILLPAKKSWEFIKACRQLEKSGIPEPEFIEPIFNVRSRRGAQRSVARVNSRLGFIRHARSYRLRKYALARLVSSPTLEGKITVRPNRRAIGGT